MFGGILFVSFASLTLCLDEDDFVYVKRGPLPLPATSTYYSEVPEEPLFTPYRHRPDGSKSLEISDDLENISKFASTVLRYFDYERGGQTWLGNFLQDLVNSREGRSQLGQFLGWKGDLLEPLAILSLCTLSAYIVVQILTSLGPSVAIMGSRTFSSFTSLLAKAIQTLWDKLIVFKDFNVDAINTLVAPFLDADEGGDPTEASRRRRAVEKLGNIVEEAIWKYQKGE